MRRAPAASRLHAAVEAPQLLPEQQAAVDALVAALDGEAGAPREQLLHGVTGSGKTEVYLAAVEAALERGRGAIVLVPEIGLAPQAVARFRARLGDRFAVLHSALSDGERFDEWQRLRSGEAQVCVGPRSAIFAPVHDLGLVVIDEEHDASYKQEGDPTYDARAVARHRAARARRRPRRRHRDAAPGDLARAAPPGAAAPRRRPAACRRSTSSTCAKSTRARARCTPTPGRRWRRCGRRGSKAIVMVNRRGFAPWLTCRSCGHHWGCPNCDVSLIVHRESGRLVCHHCAHSEPAPRACPVCASTTLARAGAGTELIEELLRERLAPMPVFRLDSDTTAQPRRPRPDPGRIRRGGERRPGRHPDGRQGPRLPRGDAERDPRRRRDPALPRLPRRGADLRDGRPAGRALRARRGRGRGDGADAGAAAPPRSSTPPPTTRPGSSPGELERRRILRYPPYSHLLRVNLSSESEETARRGRRRDRRRTALPPPGRIGTARAGADVPGAGTAPAADPGQGAGPRGDGGRGARRRSSAAPPTGR